MTPEGTNHGERITAVEIEVRALTADVAKLATIVRDGHQATHDEIQALGKQISTFGKANWPTYFGAISIVFAIGAAVLGPTWLRVSTVELETKEIRRTQNEHALLPIHPVAAEQLKLINWRLNHLEEKQQTKGK